MNHSVTFGMVGIGDVAIDTLVIIGSHALHPGIPTPPAAPPAAPPATPPATPPARTARASLLLHDEWLVVVNKPSGELVHPGWARGEPTTMSRTRDALGSYVHPVHRLDRGTSGVVLLARDKDTLRALQRQWPKVEKSYLALVRGTPDEAAVIDHPVRKGEKGTARVAARTRFTRLGTSPQARCSLVHAVPETGRLHQIRRHFKHISHPLIGDVRYGKGAINRDYRATWNLHRLALHALRLRFVHPVTEARVEVIAPLPADLGGPLHALGFAASLPPDASATSQTDTAS